VRSAEGLLILTPLHSPVSVGHPMEFDSMYGAPSHLTRTDLFVTSKDIVGGFYVVPPQCVFRLAGSPLQVSTEKLVSLQCLRQLREAAGASALAW
jgi:hypothetical protein